MIDPVDPRDLAFTADQPYILTGRQFGRLTVLEATERAGKAVWHCWCACGRRDVFVAASDLTMGRARSCGCLRKKAPGE